MNELLEAVIPFFTSLQETFSGGQGALPQGPDALPSPYQEAPPHGPSPSQAASPTSIHSVNQDDIWREVEKTGQACSSAPPAAREVEVGPSTGVEEEALSPVSRRVKRRMDLFTKGPGPVSLDDVEAIVRLKRDVVAEMTHLDPDPFWIEQANALVADSIVTPAGPEYCLETLSKKLAELRQEGTGSRFFKRLVKVRRDFGLLGRFF